MRSLIQIGWFEDVSEKPVAAMRGGFEEVRGIIDCLRSSFPCAIALVSMIQTDHHELLEGCSMKRKALVMR